jgi:hypothetical protein
VPVTSPPTVTRPPAMEIGSEGSVCAPAVLATQTNSIHDSLTAVPGPFIAMREL